jgi:hypothetical protein
LQEERNVWAQRQMNFPRGLPLRHPGFEVYDGEERPKRAQADIA